MRTTSEENNHRWVDLLALQVGDVDLEVPERILGQPNFIRWGPPGDIHGVGLSHHRDNRSRIGPNARSVKGAAGGVDIKSSEDLGGRGIETENDLDTAVRILS